MKKQFSIQWVICFFWASICFADGEGNQVYQKKTILTARFGEAERQELLKKAYGLHDLISKTVIGQERVSKALQDRLVQYLENFGTRKKDPIAIHLIGLPGIGKSEMLNQLENVGIPFVKIDVQNFSRDSSPVQSIVSIIDTKKVVDQPLIVLFDEIDKIPEIEEATLIKERTNPIIGLLNQALTDGKIPISIYTSKQYDLSNVFIVTSMNFSPQEIEQFSGEVLDSKKSFYEFTIDDFSKFDFWLRKKPSAVPKILSRLFRSNTVSRLSPNTLIVKSLTSEDYEKIVRLNLNTTIEKATTGKQADKQVQVSYTDDFVKFLMENTVYPPSGARETVAKVNRLGEQLIQFGTKAKGDRDRSLAQPRDLLLDYDINNQKVGIYITPRTGYTKKLGKSFALEVAFDEGSDSFVQPTTIAIDSSQLKIPFKKHANTVPVEKPISKKEILAARERPVFKEVLGLAEKIDKKLIGQGEYSKLLEEELSNYLGTTEPTKKNPPFMIIAGFPGIGKSELVNLAGKNADIPIVRMNMQVFSGTESDTMKDFISQLERTINQVEAKHKKYILFLEEIDKVFEVHPQDGKIVDRPIMTFIKDLLNDGVIEYTNQHNSQSIIDIRSSYCVVTMNFGIEQFGFKSDPRLTTIEDMLKAWKRLKAHPEDLNKVLTSMFRPETVSRLMPHFSIMKPLEAEDYRKLIQLQIDSVIQERLVGKDGKNRSLVRAKFTDRYLDYLYRESVIPAQGARYTVLTSKHRFSNDLESALKNISRFPEIHIKPLDIEFDFDLQTSMIKATAFVTGIAEPKILAEKSIALSFPPLDIQGKISRKRLHTAVHEFGHAFSGVSFGRRFEYATVVPPENGVGGYVKFSNHPQNAKNHLASILTALGSRAMERIFLSETPLKGDSVLDISSGPSSDIKSATQDLWSAIYEFGFDPSGIVMERSGAHYAAFSALSTGEVAQLGMVLKDLENYLVEFLLKANPQAWYRDKIVVFARSGGMLEKDFYELLGYPFPGENSVEFGVPSKLDLIFEKDIQSDPQEARKIIEFKQGSSKTTAAENLEAARRFFQHVLENRLHNQLQK